MEGYRNDYASSACINPIGSLVCRTKLACSLASLVQGKGERNPRSEGYTEVELPAKRYWRMRRSHPLFTHRHRTQLLTIDPLYLLPARTKL